MLAYGERTGVATAGMRNMIEAMLFTYGMLVSFVLSGASRNQKMQRRNSRILEYFGYALLGCSATLSIALFIYAGAHFIWS